MSGHATPVSRADCRPPLWLAFCGWLTFVLAPALLLWVTIQRGVALEEDRLRIDRTGLLTQEYEAFRRELETPGYVERRLGDTLRELWSTSGSGTTLLARCVHPGARRDLWRHLQRRAGVPVLGVAWHGPDTGDCWIHQRSDWPEPLPRRALLRFMAVANQQHLRRSASARKNRDGAEIATVRRDTAASRSFLALTLGDVVRAQVVPGRCAVLISPRFGGGRIYVYYHVFTVGTSGDAPIAGGCLVVVRERDLAARAILQEVSRRSLTPGLQRGWHIVAAEQGKRWMRRDGALPITVNTTTGRVMVGRPGPWFSHLLASRGTFHSRSGTERFVLTVRIAAAALEHPWHPHLGACRSGLTAMVLLGGVLFLHLGLYGFGTSSRLAHKIALGSLVAACFPVLLLTVGLFIYGQSQESRILRTVVSRLQFGQQVLDRLVRQHIVDLGQQLMVAGDRLTGSELQYDILRPRIRTTLAELPVQDVFGLGADGQTFHLILTQRELRPEPRSIETAMAEVARTYARGLQAAQNLPGFASDSSLLGIQIDLNSVGDFLARPGRIMPYRVLGQDHYLAALPVHGSIGPNGARTTIALLVRFNESDILDHFLRQHRPLLQSLHDRLEEWQLRVAVLSTDRYDETGMPAVLDEGDPGACRPLVRLIDAWPDPGETITFSRVNADRRALVSALRLPRMPALILTWAEAPQRADSAATWCGLMIYIVLLVLAVFAAMNQAFHDPVLRLAHVATEVADGRYPDKVDIGGGRELRDLGVTFAGLIQVLRHRDELAHFVSDEVLTAVREDSEKNLAPGGELTEVTVVFAGLQGFKSWVTNAPAETAVQVLDTLLAAGATIVRRHGGSLDKIVEDTLMAVFRDRPDAENHAVRAVHAALALRRQLPELLAPIAGATGPRIPEIGIASGSVLSGRIGSRRGTLDFSVIGNAVNLASRFKGQAHRAATTQIVVAPATLRLLRGRARVQFIARVDIKGRTRTFPLYELQEMRDL